MLEHVEGEWRHPQGVWSISRVIKSILTSSSAALGYWALLVSPLKFAMERWGSILLCITAPSEPISGGFWVQSELK